MTQVAHGRQLHLNLNILNIGYFSSSWRMEGVDPFGFAKPDHYIECARIAERGTFDAIFMADRPTFADWPPRRPFQSLEPTVVLAAIAAATRHVGLIGTVSTTFNNPRELAWRLASLNALSGGRAACNLVTTSDLDAARNFGGSKVLEHGERYARADRFTHAMRAWWRGEDEGGILPPSAPQTRPLLVQAGGSPDGRDFAIRHADAVFTLARTEEDAAEYAGDIRRRLVDVGRAPDSIKILPGLTTVIGKTRSEARDRHEALTTALSLEAGLERLANTLGVAPESLDPDGYLPATLEQPRDHNQTMFKAAVALARKEALTVRQLVARLGGGGGHRIVSGTPDDIADTIEDWFGKGLADGFNLMPATLPQGAAEFVDKVVPILRERGLFRHSYTHTTLQGHFGLGPLS